VVVDSDEDSDAEVVVVELEEIMEREEIEN
jgi:hypothetical protein